MSGWISSELSFCPYANLPGYAVFIGGPAEFFAERIFIERHEHLAAGGEPAEDAVDLFFGVTVYAERCGGGEGEVVFYGAVDAGEHLAGECEAGVHDGAFGALLVGTVLLDDDEPGVVEEPEVEVHGFFGLAGEHEEIGDRLHEETIW